MSRSGKFDDEARALLIQTHQLEQADRKLGELDLALDAMQATQRQNAVLLDEAIAVATLSMQAREHVTIVFDEADLWFDAPEDTAEDGRPATPVITLLDTLAAPDAGASGWAQYLANVESYRSRHQLAPLESPFNQLMTPAQRVALEQRIKAEFSIQGPNCDKYDYMIAGTVGLIGGIIDILFVGLPGQGVLTKVTDEWVNSAVRKFASLVGWKGARDGKDPTASAIGYLERLYRVNYDHRHGGDVNGAFRMSTMNHHIKSLGHSPDLVGLFFSILGQFTNTAHFVSGGKLITIDTENFELQGGTLAAKLFAGFANWLGHLFSDVAGSSGASGRGSGIPIPFYSLLQFIDAGEFGQHRQTFATIAVQVFEEGYDLRHGLAMAIPVLITEMLTRLLWVTKQRFYHKRPWRDCIPSASVPELRRMLLVAHGALCLVDVADATLRSGGDLVQFMLRSNLIAWVRLGSLALKELTALVRQGSLDVERVDAHLEAEYRRMLAV
ncbi:hypothetical protein [Cupriavidus nantongensis]|uniref:hypothetical protein n=1 Tax=Cupriavidus nantongensis TaxID=1796606 RepID=UPI00358EBA28